MVLLLSFALNKRQKQRQRDRERERKRAREIKNHHLLLGLLSLFQDKFVDVF